MKSLSNISLSRGAAMFTVCLEWTDGAGGDAEMELVKPGMKGEAGRGSRIVGRSPCP